MSRAGLEIRPTHGTPPTVLAPGAPSRGVSCPADPRLRRERRYGRGRRGKYQVVSVLLNLTGAVQPHVLDMTEETLDAGGLRLQVVQRTC